MYYSERISISFVFLLIMSWLSQAVLFYCGSPYDVYSIAILLPHTGRQVSVVNLCQSFGIHDEMSLSLFVDLGQDFYPSPVSLLYIGFIIVTGVIWEQ